MKISYPKIGAHVSAAGDISLAPERALEESCECFQFFSRPPQGGPAKAITAAQAEKFKAVCNEHGLESYIHTPYYINLASERSNIYYGSITAIRDELERGSLLGVRCVMAHMGSAKDLGEKAGVKKVIEGLLAILKDYKGTTELILENSAGAGMIIGDSFEELAAIVNSAKLKKYDLGICFDTCHGFASGYDLRDTKAVAATFKKFDAVIGKDKLRLIHANDSLGALDSRKDRHAHIGEGEIGKGGFDAIVALAKKRRVNMILETPHDEKLEADIRLLKSMRHA